MTTLADALRALIAAADSPDARKGERSDGHSGIDRDDWLPYTEIDDSMIDAAREALAAHDAAVSAGDLVTHGHTVIANGEVVAYGRAGSPTLAAMRAERIVACVNACTGIADPAALVAAFVRLADYVGGSDERPGHPCRMASDVLDGIDADTLDRLRDDE